VLEPLDWVGDDPAAAAGEAHHGLERRERTRRGLRRAARRPQVLQQVGDVVDRDRGDRPPPERREKVAVELVAARLERARMTLAGGDLGLEALEPPAGTGLERKPRREGQLPFARRRDQRRPRTPRLGDGEPNRAKAQPARVAPADRVLAVSLAVDAALDANAGRGGGSHRNPPCWDRDPGRERRRRTSS